MSLNSHLHKRLDSLVDFLKLELDHDPHKFPLEIQRKLLLGAACHDFGEAILESGDFGDVMSDFRTSEHEEREKTVFRRVLELLVIDADLKQEVLEAYIEVVENKNSFLYSTFNAIERQEYVMTLLHILQKRKEGKHIKSGKIIFGAVLKNQIKPLINYAAEYHAILHFLCKHAPAISEMFAITLQYYPVEAKEEDLIKFNEAVRLWEFFRTNNHLN